MKSFENVEITKVCLPEVVEWARSDKIASKVLELYGLAQPSFNHAVDDEVSTALGFMKRRNLLVANSGFGVAGFVSFTTDRETASLTVHHLAVDRPFQGMGVGGALLEHVETEAENSGAIYSVNLRSLGSAVGFYEKRGYKNIGDEIDTNMMQLRLPRL